MVNLKKENGERTVEINIDRFTTLVRHEDELEDFIRLILDATRLGYVRDEMIIFDGEKILDYMKLKFKDIYNAKLKELKKEKEEKEKEDEKKENEKKFTLSGDYTNLSNSVIKYEEN